MAGHLRSQGLKFGERQIGDALRRINAPANARRRQNAGRSFNPRTYNADYFGHKIHFDQNEKLGMYGVVHVCARDGFSGLIVKFATMSRKNNFVIYDRLFK